jgi:hypothetical protein
VVVSSVTPFRPSASTDHRFGSSANDLVRVSTMTCHSSGSSSVAGGTAPAFSNSAPLCTSNVASPPSSSNMFGPSPSGHTSACWVHHQYSSSDSPFQANTGTPRGSSTVPFGPTAIAAAAWSCVEKMLHDAHRTLAPNATRVSINTAVWIVMCNDPVTRAPASGCASANSARRDIRPGISCSASAISLRPQPANDRSATLNSPSVKSPSDEVDIHQPLVETSRTSSPFPPERGQLKSRLIDPAHATTKWRLPALGNVA